MPQKPKSCTIIRLVFTGNKGSILAASANLCSLSHDKPLHGPLTPLNRSFLYVACSETFSIRET